MKKFLSLVLALVMTMSLVTISAGAKDFTDDEAITYDEAVAVMSAVKVIDGYTDDSFKPTATLTRGAAAKIICNLILGPTTAAELPASVAPFKDVPANSTFAGYIAYCAKEGIVGGYADGTFKPGNSLTGYAFMKMLLGALGYDAEIEGYNTPGSWSISVAKQALGIGLNAGLVEDFNGVKAVTREEACLYAFNTLRATMVDYEAKTTVNVGDATVTVAGSTAKPVTWAEGINHDGNIKRDGFVQFAEQYFTKLEEEDTTDVFGRPSRKWDYKGDEIDTYVNHDLLVESYTDKVTGKDLYNLLGSSTIKDYDVAVYVDGETEKAVLGDAFFTAGNLVKTNTEKVGETGKGVLTEVYVDSDAKEVTIAIINTYLAIADNDYNTKKETASFDVYKIDNKGTATNKQFVKTKASTETMVVANDDINVENIEKDDMVLVTVADGAIQSIVSAEVVEDTSITKFSVGSYIVADGEEYKYASTAMYDAAVLDEYDDKNLKETVYNVVLDQYGYLIGLEIVEEADKYVFLTGMDTGSSNLYNKTADANVIFLDGTMKTVKVNLSKSYKDDGTTNLSGNAVWNTWCTFSVDKDGVYTLNQVKAAGFVAADKVGQKHDTAATVINKKNISLQGQGDVLTSYGTDKTVYLTATTKGITASLTPGGAAIIIDGIESVSTGIQTTSIDVYNTAAYVDNTVHNDLIATGNETATYVSYGVYNLFDKDGDVIAAVVIGEDDGVSSKYAYVTSTEEKSEAYDSATGEYTWVREVIIAGQETELTYVDDTLNYIGATKGASKMDANKWYKIDFYADGTVRKATAVNFSTAGDEFVDKIEDVAAAVNAKDFVLLFENMTSYALTVKSNTLWAEKLGTPKGFPVASDAKIILIQDKKVEGASDPAVMKKVDITDYTGLDGLKKAIKDLNDNNNFNGYISATFNSGIADTVVIYDRTSTTIDTGVTGDIEGLTLNALPVNGGAITGTFYDAGASKTGADYVNTALKEIESKLVAAGYAITDKYVDNVAGNYVFKAYNKATGFTETFTLAKDGSSLVEVFKVDYKARTTSGGAVDTNWKVSGPTYVKNGDTIKVTISHDGWTSGDRYVQLEGAATTTKSGALTQTNKSATVTTAALSGVTADGTVYVVITNS